MSFAAQRAAQFTELASVEVGHRESLVVTVDAGAVDAFARVSGDDNPLHMDDAFAQSLGFSSRVVHGALLGSYVSRLLGTVFPGPGCLWARQSFQWRLPVFIGDRVEIAATVKHKSVGTRTMVLQVEARNQDGKLVMDGEGLVTLLAVKFPVK